MTTTWLTQLAQSFAKPFQWWVVIAPWERGVRVRCGKRSKLLTPGLRFRVPFLDRVFVQSIRLRTLTTDNQTITTKDGETITVSHAVQFAIRDVQKLYDNLSNPESVIRAEAKTTIAEIVATSLADTLTPAKLMEKANQKLDQYQAWGMADVSIQITGYARVRTFRLIQHEHDNGANLWSLEQRENDGNR